MRQFIVLLALFCLVPSCYAQFYDVSLVRANDSQLQSSLVYDINSTSYKDNSLSNMDLDLRICASSASELYGKYYALAYADGFDGDYLVVTHGPAQITSVPPDLCPILPLEISSFKAWYPSIPYVFISNTSDMNQSARWKLSRLRGWFDGDFGVNRTQIGNQVNITVANATTDAGAVIGPDVDYLVVGLVREDYTTMDTVITSPMDNELLYSDSPSAPYEIFINGIGPDLPPYVEILTPEPLVYDTGTLPFTYIMFDDDDIVDCWYVLDGLTVNMPVCGIAYILNVGEGTHSLTLYGEDTTGNIGSDNVIFQVGGAPSPPGGGPPGTPYYPTIPSPPPAMFLTTEVDECVVIDYPLEGDTYFTLTSTANLTGVECIVRGDFEEYTTVEIPSEIQEGQSIRGRILVEMDPLEILDYDGSNEGSLQCIGYSEPTLIGSTISNICLILNKPQLELQNKSMEFESGERFNVSMLLSNNGFGNATAINLTVEIPRYKDMIFLDNYPEGLAVGESELVTVIVDLWDVEEGTYTVPIDIYEMGRFMTRGHLAVNVEKPELPYDMCRVSDLTWTLLILVIGFVFGMRAFYYKLKSEIAFDKKARRKRKKWEKYRKPLKHFLLIMGVALLLWTIVVWLLTRCE